MTDRLRRTLALFAPALVLVASVTAACGQQVSGEAVAGAERAPSTARSSRPSASRPARVTVTATRATRQRQTTELSALAGRWTGEYTCAQGETGLTLKIKPVDDAKLEVVFEFYPLPDNPDVRKGSYLMVGGYTGDRLIFRQHKWIDQPPSFFMVDLEVTSPVTEGVDVLSGDVLDGSCRGFTVRRA